MENQSYEFGEMIALYSFASGVKAYGVVIKVYIGFVENYYDVWWFNSKYGKNYSHKTIEQFKQNYDKL